MRVLVTGGAGLVGSHTAEYYAKKGDEVIALDNLMRSSLFGYNKDSVEFNWNYLAQFSNIKRIKGDVREEAEKVSEENGLITKISKMELAEGNAEFIGMAKFTRNGARLFIDEMNEIVKDRLDASFIGAIMGLIGKGHKIYSSDIGNAKWVDIDFEKDLKLAESIFSK